MGLGNGRFGVRWIALGVIVLAGRFAWESWVDVSVDEVESATTGRELPASGATESEIPVPAGASIERRSAERESAKPATRVVTGRVVDRMGKPLSGARVDVYHQILEPMDLDLVSCEIGEPQRFETVVSDPRGCFSIEDVPSFGRMHFSVAMPGYVVLDSSEQPIELRSDLVLDVGDLVVEPALAVSIRVVDDQQRPIEGAVVSSFLSLDRITARTDANGHCVLERLAAVEHAFFAQAEGYAPAFADPSWVDLKATDAKRDFTITLVRTSFVSGRVIDEKGHPIEGASVVAERHFGIDFEHPNSSRWVEVARTRSSVAGAFVLRAMSDGPAMLRARIGNEASSMQLVWNGDTPVDLVIDRSRWLEIEVVDRDTGLRLVPDWLLVFGAKRGVSSRWIISDAGAEQIATAISEDRLIRSSWSEFRMDDLDGYGVAAEVVGYLEGSSELLPFPIVNGQRIRVAVQRGRVVSGTTAPGAEVTWIESPHGARRGRVVMADAVGRFRLERASLGECELRVRVPQSESIVRTIPEDPKGADVELDLR